MNKKLRDNTILGGVLAALVAANVGLVCGVNRQERLNGYDIPLPVTDFNMATFPAESGLVCPYSLQGNELQEMEQKPAHDNGYRDSGYRSISENRLTLPNGLICVYK